MDDSHGAVGLVRPERWLVRLDPGVTLRAGQPTTTPLRVPVDDARWMLRGAVRGVAGVSEPTLVWTCGMGELLVRLDGTGLACAPGVLTVFIAVACDQLPDGASIEVPFGVGRPDRPAGLVMSTLAEPTGAPVVVGPWSASLVAFAWAAVLRLAEVVCAAVGHDPTGAPLVPAAIAADRDVLLVQPAARHRSLKVDRP